MLELLLYECHTLQEIVSAMLYSLMHAIPEKSPGFKANCMHEGKQQQFRGKN